MVVLAFRAQSGPRGPAGVALSCGPVRVSDLAGVLLGKLAGPLRQAVEAGGLVVLGHVLLVGEAGLLVVGHDPASISRSASRCISASAPGRSRYAWCAFSSSSAR